MPKKCPAAAYLESLTRGGLQTSSVNTDSTKNSDQQNQSSTLNTDDLSPATSMDYQENFLRDLVDFMYRCYYYAQRSMEKQNVHQFKFSDEEKISTNQQISKIIVQREREGMQSPEPPRKPQARFAPQVASSPIGTSPNQADLNASYNISGIAPCRIWSKAPQRASPKHGSRGPPTPSATYGAYPQPQQGRNISSRMATMASMTRSVPHTPVGPLYSSAPGAMGRSPSSPVPSPDRRMRSAGAYGNKYDVVPLRRPCDICPAPQQEENDPAICACK